MLKHLESIKLKFEKKSRVRSAMQKCSSDAQQTSKRAIFAFHRDDPARAQALLKDAGKFIGEARKEMTAFSDLSHAGFYREAMEEYVEACLYAGFLSTRKVLKNNDDWGDMETYIGGLSDTTGEVVRWAVARATDHDIKSVKEALAFVNDAVEFFLSLDLTGYLRTKADQAKKNLRSLEQILYELSLRA